MTKPKIITITMTWNEVLQKWLMKHTRDNLFIYDFFDCGNVKLIFKGLDKEKAEKYRITIEHLEN